MGASTDLLYRIFSVTDGGDGFKKTGEEAEATAAKLDEAGKRVDDLGGKKVDVPVETDAEQAGDKLKKAGQDADNAGKSAESGSSGFAHMSAGMIAAVAGAAALAPALAAIPAMLGAVGAGIGTLVLGFGGIAKALGDYSSASSAAGQSGAQLAATEFANSVAIRSAQQAIVQARQQASISAINSAQSIAQAEERLQEAETNEQYAQQSLTQARQDAATQLIQLNEAAKTSALDVKGAQLALEQAQQNLIKLNESGTATALEKAQAEYAVEQAENNLANTQEKAKEAANAANIANQKGVEGSPGVVSAKRAEADAARQVHDAQVALATAQRNAADAQIQSSQAIQKAVQNLADTQRQQALAAAAASASSSSGWNQFAADMRKLTPAGQDFVRELISMRGGLDELKATAQNNMLPGVGQGLREAAPLFPLVNTAVAQMGQIIAGVVLGLGGLAQNPVFRGQLAQVMKDGLGAAQSLGSAVAPMIGGITAAAAHAGPIVSALAGGFHDLLATGLPAFFAGLVSNAAGAGQSLGGILGIATNLLGPLGTLAGAVSGALGPAIHALVPVISTLATDILNALLPLMPTLSNAFLQIVNVVAQLMPILGPLLPILGQLLVQDLQILSPLLAEVAGFLQQNASWLEPLAKGVLLVVAAYKTLIGGTELVKLGMKAAGEATKLFTAEGMIAQAVTKAWAAVQAAFNAVMDANPITLVILAVAGLVAGVIYAWDHFKGFRDFVKQMWADIQKWFSDALNFIENNIWKPEIQGAKDAWALIKEYIIGPVTDAWHFTVNAFDSVVSFFQALPGRLEATAIHLWDAAKRSAGEILTWVQQGWDKVVGYFTHTLPGILANAGAHLWDWVTGGLGAVSNTVSTTFKLIVDGVIKGFNWVIDQINSAVGGLSDTWSWAGIPPIPTIPHIPLLAAGGTAIAPGLAIVGDRGPEVLSMDVGATILPLDRAFGGHSGAPQPWSGSIDLKLNGQQIDQILVAYQRNGGTLESVANGVRTTLGTVPR